MLRCTMKIYIFLALFSTICIHGMQSSTTQLRCQQIFKIPPRTELEIALKVPLLKIIARGQSREISAQISHILNSLVGDSNEINQEKTIRVLSTLEITKQIEFPCQLGSNGTRRFLYLDPHLSALGITLKEIEISLTNDIQLSVIAHDGAIELQTDGSLVEAKADTIEYQPNLQTKPLHSRLLYRGSIGTNKIEKESADILLVTTGSICLKPIQ